MNRLAMVRWDGRLLGNGVLLLGGSRRGDVWISHMGWIYLKENFPVALYVPGQRLIHHKR